MESFDLVVIGAGPGGYPAAIRAAQLGAHVALVEKEELGGTCLNWGCIPTKTLLATSDLYAHIRAAAEMGIHVEGATVDYPTLIRRKDQIVARLRGGIQQLLAANRVTLFKGLAAFESRNRITVSPSGTGDPLPVQTLESAHTIISTGSTSAMPGFLPRHPAVCDSRLFLKQERLPKSVLVLGGGIIGCELACLLGQLGAQVTVVELLPDILSTLDADVRREVRRHMESTLGIRIFTGQALEGLAADESGVRGQCGGQNVQAEMLLAALGRKPVTAGLKLENAGITPDAKGFIPVDEYGESQAAGVYAVGDVNGGIQLAHNATSQGLCAAENACGQKRRKFERLVPSCIFTAPEIGTAGLSEDDARGQGREVKVGKFAFAALGKAIAAGHKLGFVKWIVDAHSDQLLGAAAVGAQATELIAPAALAIRAELTAREVGRTIHAHPTLSEAWMEAAHAVHGEAIHGLPRKK